MIAALMTTATEAWGGGPDVPQQANPRLNGIDVVKVDGLLDPPTASLVRDSIREANRRRSTMIVLQLDSGGSVDVDVQPLLRDVQQSRVPVVVWVGPSGAMVPLRVGAFFGSAAKMALLDTVQNWASLLLKGSQRCEPLHTSPAEVDDG